MPKVLEFPLSFEVPAEAREIAKTEPVMMVSLESVQNNFRKLSAMTSGTCAAIVKGDGYGHGMLPCSLALKEVGSTVFFCGSP